MAEGETMVADTGEFTQAFTDHVAAEFPESKAFDDVKNISGLAKAFHVTKSMVGTQASVLQTANESLGKF